MYLLAYIDPGTGSFFLQLLTGSLFGALFILRRSWNQVRGLLNKKK
jgi:hypothetical protein